MYLKSDVRVVFVDGNDYHVHFVQHIINKSISLIYSSSKKTVTFSFCSVSTAFPVVCVSVQ